MSSNGKPLIYAFYNDVTKEITERVAAAKI